MTGRFLTVKPVDVSLRAHRKMTMWKRSLYDSLEQQCAALFSWLPWVCVFGRAPPVSISTGVPSLATLPRFISVQRQ